MTATAPVARAPHRWVLLVVVALLGHALVAMRWPAAHALMIDLQVYRAGAEQVLAGRPLYDGGVLLDLPFVYPPFAAVAFLPLTVPPLWVVKAVWTTGTLLLLGYVARRSLRSVGLPAGVAATLGIVALASWLDPVRTTLYLGQINVLVLALVLGDALGRPGSRWRGVGIGLAAALKLTPLLFIGYLLLTGRRRAAGTAAAVFGLAAAGAALVAPGESRRYWWEGTFAAAGRISDVAATTNHSLNGLLARAMGEGPATRACYLAGAAALAAATLLVAARLHRRADELAGLTLCGLASAALAPFAWSHHWVWCVPLIVVLGRRVVARPGSTRAGRAAAAGLAVVLLGTVAVITALPGPGVGPIPRTGLISLAPDTYLVLFLLVLVVAAAEHRSGRPVDHRDVGVG